MANQTAILEALKRVPFLRGLDENDRKTLAGVLKTHRLDDGATLFREGRPGDSMLIVATGRLSVRVTGTDGKAAEVAGIYPGDVVGEMACVDPGPRSATVVADRRSIALELDRMTLQAMLSHMPRVAVAVTTGVIKTLTDRIRKTNRRIEEELEGRGFAIDPPPTDRPQRFDATAQGKAHTGKINLRTVPCLTAFTDDQLRALLKIAPPRTYKSGLVLCQEGATGDGCFIIVRGAVEVFRRIHGAERVLATLESGSLVGQMSLVDASPRSASVRTKGESVILALHRDAFQRLLKAAHPLGPRFQEQIAIAGIRQLRMANKRLATLLGMPREHRPARGAITSGEVPTRRRASALPRPGAERRSTTERPAPRASVPTPPKRQAPPAPPRRQAPTLPPRQKPAPGPRPPANIERRSSGRSEEERFEDVLAYMQTALDDWDMEMWQLDEVSVSRAGGEMSAAEKSIRNKK